MRLGVLETRSSQTGAVRPITTDLLAATFLAPVVPAYPLLDALAHFPAPWRKSFELAPDEVGELITVQMRNLAMATPGLTVEAIDLARLPHGRARDHLAALTDLWRRIGDALPADLATIRHVLRCGVADAVEALPIASRACLYENRAEADLREHLTKLFGNSSLAGEMEASFALGTLGHLQSNLTSVSEVCERDDSVQVFGFRNALEEIAFTAARAQTLISEGVEPHEIGVLIPDDTAYLKGLPPAFSRIGIQVTGMPSHRIERDHAGEFLLHLLAILKGPAPRMALASLTLSPLISLPVGERSRISNEFAERGWSAAARDSELAGFFEELRAVASPAQLVAKLTAISKLTGAGETLAPRINSLRPILAGDEIDWTSLLKMVEPRRLPVDANPRFVEGVSIFTEQALPWRRVRHLFVLGMAGPNWPSPASTTPFFTESEIALIRTSTCIALPSRGGTMRRSLELFQRQLGAASGAVTFTVPARDLDGKQLAASTALSLVARALGEANPGDIVLDPYAQDGLANLIHLRAVGWHFENGKPILPDGGEVALGRNPFRLRLDDAGEPRPQSPTALETLYLSPLAWLLGELDAKDKTWCPERLDVMTLGSIIHATLERLFPMGVDVPDEQGIDDGVEFAFSAALAREARWLEDPTWSTERANLLREVRLAATGWSRFLRANGAAVRAVETWLYGTHPSGIGIRGKSDCLIDLPDGRVIVVDHKRSSSGNRRVRMEAGADLQVELYRTMIRQNPEFSSADPGRIITAYHCTLDGRILAGPEGAGLEGAKILDGDIGSGAISRLGEIVDLLSNGTLSLNTSDDVKIFEKMGIKPYALIDNSFVRAFIMPSAADNDEVTADA